MSTALGTNENGFGPIDSDSIIIAEADLTATDATNAFTIPEEVALGSSLGVLLACPSAPTGTDPTLAAVVTSTDADNKISISHVDTIEAEGNYIIPLPPVRSSGWNLSVTIGGTSTPTFADFSAALVKVGHAVLPVT